MRCRVRQVLEFAPTLAFFLWAAVAGSGQIALSVGCPTNLDFRLTDQAPRAVRDCTVYITRTGSRYHVSSCKRLQRSRYSMPRSEALKRGYSPCRVCGGSECEED